MKYNTFWGHVFWVLLLISTLSDLRPLLINLWNLIYNGSIGGSNWIMWILGMFFFAAIIMLKTVLLREFFPRHTQKFEEIFGRRERCMLCAGICVWYALIMLVIVIFLGGLKVFQGMQLVQMTITMLTPFMFIYYLVREEER